MRPAAGLVGLALLLGCGRREGKVVAADSAASALPADSLVLSTKTGAQVWLTLARDAVDSSGGRCLERGLEIREGSRRVKVPLLYTRGSPVLVNDSTIRAQLWTHCRPGDMYLVNLRTGHPVRERPAHNS